MQLIVPPTNSTKVAFSSSDVKNLARQIAAYLLALEDERGISGRLVLCKLENEFAFLKENKRAYRAYQEECDDSMREASEASLLSKELHPKEGVSEFDTFYMAVIDRLLEIDKLDESEMKDGMLRERERLDSVREFLEYVEDRELYRGISYKEDVMDYIKSRVSKATLQNYSNVVLYGKDAITNILYHKDASVAIKKEELI